MPADTVTPKTRSRIMASIKSKDTKPEIAIRSALHRKGFRYRLHCRKLPGKPDFVLPRYRAVVFVHGCFWHGHDCKLFRLPSTRTEFWRDKIQANAERDQRHRVALCASGWRIATIWECAIKGKSRLPFPELIATCEVWLKSTEPMLEIRGMEPGQS